MKSSFRACPILWSYRLWLAHFVAGRDEQSYCGLIREEVLSDEIDTERPCMRL
jgi:hypothetical protein